MKNILLLTFLLTLCSLSINATDYYVAKTGDNNNPGTADQPFLTISKAASIMVAGDNCFIKEGVYREILNPANAGSAGNPITFSNFEDDKVVIDATEVIENWSVHSGDIYKASSTHNLGAELNVLFYNDKVMNIARWPNNTDKDDFSFDGHDVNNGSGSHIEATGMPNTNWSGGYICYLGAHSGMTWTRPVSSSTSSRIDFEAVDINSWPFNPHNPTVYRNHNRGRFYLFGKLEGLDYPNEWFHDVSGNSVYAMFPDKVNPSEGEVKMGARKFTMQLNKNYITVDGLQCFGGVVEVKGNNCIIRNGVFQNCLQAIDELNNTDAQIGNAAIKLEASDITIENNLIEYGSGNGISMLTAWKGSQNYTIRNNVIRHFNTIGVHANPVRSNCPGTTITNNTIYSCGRDGIYTSGANATVAYNDVFHCMKINNDGGVFYTVGNTGLKNSTIHHNWFHDSAGPEYADGRAAGIYLDNDSKGYDVHHNVVWNVTWSALMINWNNTDINFYNNTLWNNGSAMGRWENGRTMATIKVYNNYSDVESDSEGNWNGSTYTGTDWIGTDIGTNIINSSNPFISVVDTNFIPKDGSYLIDAGEVLAGFTDGHQGTAPDIGAYESGLSRWIAGADWAEDVVDIKYNDEEENSIFNPTASYGTVSVFPNPASSKFTIRTDEIGNGQAKVSIYNSNGSCVYQNALNDSAMLYYSGLTITNTFTKGVYFIKVNTDNRTYVGKVLVK